MKTTLTIGVAIACSALSGVVAGHVPPLERKGTLLPPPPPTPPPRPAPANTNPPPTATPNTATVANNTNAQQGNDPGLPGGPTGVRLTDDQLVAGITMPPGVSFGGRFSPAAAVAAANNDLKTSGQSRLKGVGNQPAQKTKTQAQQIQELRDQGYMEKTLVNGDTVMLTGDWDGMMQVLPQMEDRIKKSEGLDPARVADALNKMDPSWRQHEIDSLKQTMPTAWQDQMKKSLGDQAWNNPDLATGARQTPVQAATTTQQIPLADGRIIQVNKSNFSASDWWNAQRSWCDPTWRHSTDIVGGYGAPDPFLAGMTPPPMEVVPSPADDTRSSMDLAKQAMHDEDWAAAARWFRAYVNEHDQDAAAIRNLGLALGLHGRVDEAATQIAKAYDLNPSLANSPIDAKGLGVGGDDLRDLVGAMVSRAHKAKDAAGWIAVVALMQAEGRDELAAKMLDRATAAGSDPGLVSALRKALAGTGSVSAR